jgi:hypothetical protein
LGNSLQKLDSGSIGLEIRGSWLGRIIKNWRHPIPFFSSRKEKRAMSWGQAMLQ